MQNVFIGKGNLGDSPVIKTVQGRNGDFVVANMRVMFGRYGADKETGEIVQMGGFWREVELYGRKAQDAARLLRKGARVIVYGEEQDFMAKNAEGKEVQVIKIVAEDVALQLIRIKHIEFEPPRSRNTAAAMPDQPAGEPAY